MNYFNSVQYSEFVYAFPDLGFLERNLEGYTTNRLPLTLSGVGGFAVRQGPLKNRVTLVDYYS